MWEGERGGGEAMGVKEATSMEGARGLEREAMWCKKPCTG